jgi:hypothetical protein
MKYCSKCDNIMDISRNPPKTQTLITQSTSNTQENEFLNPTSLSKTISNDNTEVDDNNITKLINMFKNNMDISNYVIDNDKLLKHKDYLGLKHKEKKDLQNLIKNIDDENISAYMVCKNCSFYEKITSRTLVLNKMSLNTISNNESNDYSKYKYMRYDNTLPHTRDYICKNTKCESNTNPELKDVKWFKPNQNTYETFYVCCVCGLVWPIA